MRTTIDLPEHLLVEAKKHAAESRIPLTRLVEDSLRTYLSEQRIAAVKVPPQLPVLGAPVPTPDINLDDTSQLWDLP